MPPAIIVALRAQDCEVTSGVAHRIELICRELEVMGRV